MPRTARASHRGNDVRRPHARNRPPDHRRNARRSRRHGLLAVASVRPTDRKRNAGRCCRGAVRSPHLGRFHCQLRLRPVRVRGLLGRTEPSLMRGGRTMEQYTEAFVGIDTAKKKHALAIADPGRDGETRYVGEMDSTRAVFQRMIRRLARRYEKLYFCYEAGPTGYGLYRQVRALGHDCIVVAPSLVPKRPGERVKTN